MRQLGTIIAVKSDDGIVRLDIDVAGEIVRDVLVVSELRIQPDLVKGDRVLVEQLDGADAEWIATPYRLLTTTATWEIQVGDLRVIVSGGKVQIQSKDGSPASVALKSDVESLRTTFNGHTHAYLPGPGSSTPTATPVPQASAPSGTQVLEAE